ncbi:MAG: J domain-containing protein [Bacteroidales bacterium]|nr:J domain-containing protein [Bacteroidales bacterium]
MNKIDAFKILDLPSHASKAEIKHAYRKLAKKYHPDKNSHKNSNRRFIEISEAYETLTKTSKPVNTTSQNYNSTKKRPSHFSDYNYNYKEEKIRSARAKEQFEKEFSKQSDELYERIYYKYKNSVQRRVAIAFSIIGILISIVFAYDTLSKTEKIAININTTENSLRIYQSYNGIIIANHNGTEFTLNSTELFIIRNHILSGSNAKIIFLLQTTIFNNIKALIVQNPHNNKTYICETKNANINSWIFLILILMLYPSISFLWERESFNFVFFAINYNLYGFPISLFFILMYATPYFF